MAQVPLYHGDHLTVRIASTDEGHRYGLAVGEPVLVIYRASGDIELHGAQSTDLQPVHTTGQPPDEHR